VPFNPLFAALTALQDPSQIGSLLSYVAQLYVNPSYNYPNYTYPWYFNDYVLQPLAGWLPSPLGPAIANAVNGVADGINDAFSALPDPTAAVVTNVLNAVLPTPVTPTPFASTFAAPSSATVKAAAPTVAIAGNSVEQQQVPNAQSQGIADDKQEPRRQARTSIPTGPRPRGTPRRPRAGRARTAPPLRRPRPTRTSRLALRRRANDMPRHALADTAVSQRHRAGPARGGRG
jgi:hypothetical protein